MTFSVIIPTYNSQNTILRALDSVLYQTFKDYEVIVVDDGSSDDTKSVVEEFLQDNEVDFKYIVQKNSGPSSARNRGIKNASGKYIAFLDSDDIWHPQKLEIVNNILQDKNIDIIGHGFSLDREPVKLTDQYKLKKIHFIDLLFKNFAVTPSIVVKKEKMILFDEKMRYAEDHDLWLKMSTDNAIYFLDLPLVTLGRELMSKGGLSGNRFNMRVGEMRMYLGIGKYKKSMIIFIPFLLVFSFMKHIRFLLK